ncbi:MAG TPA: VanW family protein, partial [bacterium]|nr:VanW family protein [bacterium]
MDKNQNRNFINSLRHINFKDQKIKNFYKRILFFIIPILLIIILCQAVNFLFTVIAAPNSYFLDKNISLKDKQEVADIIRSKKEELGSREIVLVFDTDDKEIVKRYYLKDILGIEAEDQTIDKIFNENFIWYDFNLSYFIKNLFYKKNYNLDYAIDRRALELIKSDIESYEVSAKNASVSIDEQNVKFTIQKEKQGFSYDFSNFEHDLLNLINNSNSANSMIRVNKIIDNPIITENDINPILASANLLLDNSPINVFYKTNVYKIVRGDLLHWIDFDYNISDNKFNEAEIKIKKDDIMEYLDHIALENDKEPKNGEIVFDENNPMKVVKFTPIEKGLLLNKEDSYNKIQDAILSSKNEVYLTVDDKLPDNMNSEVVKMGLLEEIGRGVSNFAGSSKNRVHNIEIGSSFLNGLLIKPGEEFSLINIIGQVTPDKGYLEELVIKGDRTEQEYGGGLCQVGTTMFRAALNSGFEITERQNHSYRVSYYEPAGTDATIYYPKPDLKFINNTKNYVMILTEINGTELVYKIWGTKDNRKITITEPIIKNIVLAPGTKWIETLDLKPGQKKCIESSHNGADAEFTYHVELEDGKVIDKVFKSHYKPWQAI